ncbi:MAG: hypothetical protein ACLUKN_09400 [Bacilli bacterium]
MPKTKNDNLYDAFEMRENGENVNAEAAMRLIFCSFGSLKFGS